MQLGSDVHIKDDLGGAMSVKFKSGSSFNEYCATHITNFDTTRFEVLAMRVYYGKETYITVYALDKERMKGANYSDIKVPVKKFKLQSPFIQDILPYIEECNFTLTTGAYPLDAMEIENK